MHWKSFSEKQSAKIKLSFQQEGIPRKKLKKSSLPHACKFSKSIHDFQTENFTLNAFIQRTEKKWSFDLSSGHRSGHSLLFSWFVNLTLF